MTLKEDLQSRRFWCCVLVEALGTLMLVLVILGSSAPSADNTAPPALQTALAAGLAAVGLLHCFGEISGAQVNPAVTVAFLCTRKLDLLHCLAYMMAQCLGATFAAGIFYLTVPQSAAGHLATRVRSDCNAGHALGMELFSTFQLVFTIFAVEDHRRRELGEPGSLAIGFSLTAGALTSGSFSGGSMNPARSLGPAIVTGIWEYHWVYWIGPMLGSVLAGVSYEFFIASSASREKLMACITCKDIEIVETASMSRSSLSTITQNVMRAKQTSRHDNN
ncbi:lens fiber major intrinsic protein isoform X1 [Microcaecilia unicolor]|uniref:Lens fiber major intrinsic protein isoform X1 n=1 Tax=Microcaecilia unicolor TaxID=1415580 RepID=A0A6P7X667_9AMPH|nr:lens fiber major intrinsic protein isoform X1 [Microcaecilia unicolor]